MSWIKKFKKCGGLSIIEIMIAMGIFALVSASLASLALGGFNLLARADKSVKAVALAQEGIEAVRSIRAIAWNELRYTESAVATSSNRWVFVGEGSSSELGDFTRIINFFDVCRDSSNNIAPCPADHIDLWIKRVNSRVSWEAKPGIISSVKQITYLTNYDSVNWAQTDWSSGAGQALWSDEAKYAFDDGNIEASASGNITLKSASSTNYEESGYLLSSAFDMGGASPVQIIEWDENIPDNCDIKLQLRTAPNSSGSPGAWTNWYGENGAGTYFTSASGTLVSLDLNGNQWVQYRVELSGDGLNTPALTEVRINYR